MLDATTLKAIAQEARQCFLHEDAPEYLLILNQGIESLRLASASPKLNINLDDIYKNLYRGAHSLKGGSAMAQMMSLNSLAHKIEDIIQSFQEATIHDQNTAIELLTLSLEVVESQIQAAVNNQPESPEAILEITQVLDEFLSTLQTTPTETTETKKDNSDFIKTVLNVDLEDCLTRVESLLGTNNSPNTLQQGLATLQEECQLLGQALNFSWLIEVVSLTKQIQDLNTIPLSQLATIAIAQIRQLRQAYLDNPETSYNIHPNAELTQFLPVQDTPIIAPKTEEQSPITPNKPNAQSISLNLKIPVVKLNRMGNTLGELLITYEQLQDYENQLKQASLNLKKRSYELNPLKEEVQDLYDQLTINNQSFKIQKDNSSNSEFDALHFDEYTLVHSTLQKFQELMVQVQEIREDIDLVSREFDNTLAQMRFSLDSLDEDLTQARLTTFATIARRFIQPLETLSQRHNKSVELVIEGEDVLVDQAIIEQLQTPLTHLIRNAFDHGIELPQKRVALGKPRQATIKLSAIRKTNYVLITIKDDGKGINLKQVYKKALEAKLCPTGTTFEQLTKEQILEYIFAPGLSTAKNVTSLSGRGVGLDIVRLEIEKLRGTIKIETAEGKGTEFQIRIPLTVNILSVVLSRCQKQTLALPAADIRGIISLSDLGNKSSDSSSNLTEIIWQGQSIPLVPLYQLLPYNRQIFDYSTQLSMPNVGLVLNVNDQPLVVAVDEMLGEKELVIKPFDELVPVPHYLAGCTILGSGEIVPIFIPDYFEPLLAQLSQQKPHTQPPVTETKVTNPSILVIDDSMAVRRTLNRLLISVGYNIVECRDGQEAWNVLSRYNQPFDLAICDLEMPNMDGFSLLELIRGDNHWQNLPVIILTSRESNIHRQKAMDLGANSYQTKPFQPNTFLEAIAAILNQQ